MNESGPNTHDVRDGGVARRAFRHRGVAERRAIAQANVTRRARTALDEAAQPDAVSAARSA